MLENIDFMGRYSEQISSINGAINKYKPDYILALIRKGPRLIELMQLNGLWNNDIPIISERALDFIPSDEINYKNILIFDDITITGSTIKKLIEKLLNKYKISSINVVSLAMDKDTFCADAIPGGINFDCKIALSKDERFTFSNELVKSFATLNKPYDVDYTIFYTTINAGNIIDVIQNTESYKAFDLTTKYQNDKGFKRYSFLPDKKISGFFISNFKGLYVSPEIIKVRMYYNKMTGETTIAPMVTYSMETNLCNPEITYFDDAFTPYNEIIEKSTYYINNNRELATFKLIWYISSYLYGLYFDISQSKDEYQILPFLFPSQMLRFQDLTYIFGPSFSEFILKFLDDHFEETKAELRKMKNKYNNFRGINDKYPYKIRKKYISTFDDERLELHEKISPYIKNNVGLSSDLASKISTIFEAMYYELEIPTQERIKDNGMIRVGDEERLNFGFNLKQLKSILKNEKISFSNIDFSLAMDFLIDAGIQIPIFYENKKTGMIERAYRYGEDALSAKHYGFIINNSIMTLFDYHYEKRKLKKFPAVSLEKIGIILYQQIINLGLKPILEKLMDTNDRFVFIYPPRYLLYGKVLAICDESYPVEYNPQMFVEWCRFVGMVSFEDNEKYLTYNDNWYNNNILDHKLPDLVSKNTLSKFDAIIQLLYHIDQKIDKNRNKNSDYLIAITTCADHESFIKALRAELHLFFKSETYKFSNLLQDICKLIKYKPYEVNRNINTSIKKWNRYSYSPALEIRRKKYLWDNLDAILESIDNHFAKCNRELKTMYNDKLSLYIENIRRNHHTNDFPREYEERIIIFGELCVLLSETFKNLLIIANEFTHPGAISSAIKSLNENIILWNNYIVKKADIAFEGHNVKQKIFFIKKLPLFHSCEIKSKDFNLNEFNKFLFDVVPLVEMAYVILEDMYNNNYPIHRFNEDMNRFFPKIESDNELKHKSWKYILYYHIIIDSINIEIDPITRSLTEKIKEIRKTTRDGKVIVDKENDYGKYILINNSENVLYFITGLLEVIRDLPISLRIGLCYSSDMDEQVYITGRKKQPAGKKTLKLAKTLSYFLEEKSNDIDNNALTISKGCFEDLWESELPEELNSKWNIPYRKIYPGKIKGLDIFTDVHIWKLRNKDAKLTRTIDDFVRNNPLDELKSKKISRSDIRAIRYQITDLYKPIRELEEMLYNNESDESKYQELLERSPWAFGMAYETISRHEYLDDKNIPDFTGSRRIDGCIDIFELKPPTTRIFNKDGEFSVDFNNAWTQAERYLDFIHTNVYYLQRKHISINNPKCFLIMGCNLSIDERDKIKIKERMNTAITLLTYDDLIRYMKSTVAAIKLFMARPSVPSKGSEGDSQSIEGRREAASD